MIFQEPLTRLNPLMRISEHFAETLQDRTSRGISKDEIERRSLEVLRVMGIPPTRFRAYPHEFSGGMRQRLMIALTLVLRPAFVVADEPTTALDVLVEAQIIRILHDLRRELRHLAAADHPQPRHHRRGLRPGGGDVRRGDRRDRRRARGVRAARSTPTPASCCARRSRCRTTGLNYIDGRAAGPGRAAAGLPLPPALPRRDAGLRDPRTRSSASTPAAPAPQCWAADFRPDGLADASPEARARAARAGGDRPLPTKPETRPADRPRSDDGRRHRGPRRRTSQLQGGALSRLLGLQAPHASRPSTASTSRSRSGEVLGLVGESGSGKTTLGRALLGPGAGDRGQDHLPRTADGEDVRRLRAAGRSELRALRTDLQMVFQDPHAALNPVDDHRGGGRPPAA